MPKKSSKSCCECKKTISKDENALSQKLIGVDVEDRYCVECLGAYLDCGVEDLKMKICEFKEQGCTLFL